MSSAPRVDLFGDELPGENPRLSKCAGCGASFVLAEGAGRPSRYCSTECRKTAKARQCRDYERTHGRDKLSTVTCRTCGSKIQLGDRRHGRLPAFCSKACRLDHFQPAKTPRRRPAEHHIDLLHFERNDHE